MERLYEATFIVKPDLEEEAIERIMERIKKVINDNDGKIEDVGVWGKKKLAYEIQDYPQGFYTIITFVGSTKVLNELDHNFKVMDDVLRSLIIRKDD